ncbi:MAG TPA: matrixin family metalloprotease [Opitutaceae bacterium]|nr:matrixin family metalloprotease [Opitutaceae bacterium]
MTALRAASSPLASALRLAQPNAPRLAVAGLAANEQTGTLAFSPSGTAGVDTVANVGDVGLASGTTKLTVALDLKANQKYSFSFYYLSGGPKVTLTDAHGKKTAVTMSKGFSVAKSGTYQLTFEAGYSLKTANFDHLAIRAKSVLPSSTGDKRLDALLLGGSGQWWHPATAAAVRTNNHITSSAIGLDAGSSATALTYSFLSTQPGGQSMTGFAEMTDAQKDAVRRAFDYYSKVINVTFTEVAGDGTGDINLGTNSQASSAGYANMPDGNPDKDQVYLFLANNAATNGDAGMQEGGYGWETILHEIGHTLGLKHPGNYNAGGGGTPGPYLSASDDNHQHSIMSYKDNAVTRGVNATTPMLYDVAALQYLYGANQSDSTAAGGSFTFTAGHNYLETLWSTNGTDTIDLSGLTNSSRVDLNAGTYSSINIVAPASSANYSGNNNVALAYGSEIDDVTLSSTTGVAESVTLNKAYASGRFDTIGALEAADDKINLKKSLFGSLKASNIEFGAAATKSTSKIIVNNTTGEIFYDADGSGHKSAAKKIAQFSLLGGTGALSKSNFSFVG